MLNSLGSVLLELGFYCELQMSAIFNDETGIEYVKKEGLRRNKSKMYLLKEVFGQGMTFCY